MKKTTLKLVGITAAVACAVVWASNNVDFVKDKLGKGGWF